MYICVDRASNKMISPRSHNHKVSLQYGLPGVCTLIKLYEPRHEKTCLFHMRTTKAQISLRIRSLISTFVFHCLDSMIPLVSKSEISSLYLVSVTAQTSWSLPWSQTPKTGFLVMRLVWFISSVNSPMSFP